MFFFFLTFTTACASLHLDAKPCAEPLVLPLAAGRSTLGGFNPLFYPPLPLRRGAVGRGGALGLGSCRVPRLAAALAAGPCRSAAGAKNNVMEQNRCQPPGRRMLRPARAGFSRWPCFSGCRDFIYIHLCLFSPVGRETLWRLTQSCQGLSPPASPSCSRVRSPPALSHADAFCQRDVPAPVFIFCCAQRCFNFILSSLN